MYIILCGIFVAGFILAGRMQRHGIAALLKTVASVCFVLLGFQCVGGSLVQDVSGFGRCVLCGLVLGMLGDILMGLRHIESPRSKGYFLAGILAFLFGHVLYLIALLGEAPNPWMPVLIGLVLGACVMVWMRKHIDAARTFLLFGMVYVIVVTTMAAAAVWDYLCLGGNGHMLFAIGAVLFQVSDMILIYNNFSGKVSFRKRIANLVLYYGGQLLIAGSLICF